MSNIPGDLRYTKEHEYVRSTAEAGVVYIGITDYAQGELGDIVYVELPKAGTELTTHQPLGVVESVKAVSDIYSPLTGKVVASNADLVNTPQDINADPYGKAWMIKIEVKDVKELDTLLSAAQYEDLLSKAAK